MRSMNPLTRRAFLKLSAFVIGAAIGVTTGLFNILGKAKAANGVRDYLEMHEEEKHYFPLLSIDCDFSGQAENLRDGGDIEVVIKNNGLRTSPLTVVEWYSILFNGEPLSEANVASYPYLSDWWEDRQFITNLHPGEEKILFMSHGAYPYQEAGSFFAVVYDPILDPRPTVPIRPWPQPAYHRKLIGWGGYFEYLERLEGE